MIPYRLRGFLKGLFTALVWLVVLCAIAAAVWLLWLSRFVVYTRDGVILDFESSLVFPEGQKPMPPEGGPDVQIHYVEKVDVEDPINYELTRFTGVYFTTKQLTDDFDGVVEAIKKLPVDTPIMLDVKNIKGEFYYTSDLGKSTGKIAPEKMDSLLKLIQNQGNYLIARMPALRDYWYGLDHVPDGVFVANKGSLWMDGDRCYWLHPGSEGTISYLVQIVSELKSRGVDEVMFYDFCVPETDKIYFPEDKVEIINTLAYNLARACATNTFAVSFSTDSTDFVLPNGRCRLMVQNVAAADISSVVSRLEVDNLPTKLIFMTDLMDTRFEEYCVLHPVVLPD